MTSQRKHKIQKVPVFKSRKEEAEFWDANSPLDFPDYWEDVEVEVEKPLRHEMVLSVRLDEETVRKMEDLSRQRHLGKSTLARMLIIEGLEKLGKAK
jgi:hypothetical protein